MDKSNLKLYFHSLFVIEKEVVEKITKTFKNFELSRNEILLGENKVSTRTFFLESGYMRSYIVNEKGDEVTTNIFSAPCFVNDFLSFFKEQPTKENYQTLTNCTFWHTSLENVQYNFHTIPEFREFSRLLFVINYYKLQDRLIDTVSRKAETRYLNFMKEQPDVLRHVPLKIIASYLGITDSSLSRIRKETAQS